MTSKTHERKKKQAENRENSPYVLCNNLLGGLREIQVDEIGKQGHDQTQKLLE